MTVHAFVNYHVKSDGPQAYEIDAGGVTGKIVSPQQETVKVSLVDLRAPSATANFQKDSVTFVDSSTQVSNFRDAEELKAVYNNELKCLLSQKLGAKDVIVFDHTVRVDSPDATRRPARNVHGDYSPKGAHERLRDLLSPADVADWESGHFAFINVWRPLENPIYTAPLGFVRPSTVTDEDWVTLQLIYPDRIGEILGLVANDNHEWLYMSEMRPDEVAIFNIYDNRGLASIGHSALDLAEPAQVHIPRISVESRTLVRYEA